MVHLRMMASVTGGDSELGVRPDYFFFYVCICFCDHTALQKVRVIAVVTCNWFDVRRILSEENAKQVKFWKEL